MKRYPQEPQQPKGDELSGLRQKALLIQHLQICGALRISFKYIRPIKHVSAQEVIRCGSGVSQAGLALPEPVKYKWAGKPPRSIQGIEQELPRTIKPTLLVIRIAN